MALENKKKRVPFFENVSPDPTTQVQIWLNTERIQSIRTHACAHPHRFPVFSGSWRKSLRQVISTALGPHRHLAPSTGSRLPSHSRQQAEFSIGKMAGLFLRSTGWGRRLNVWCVLVVGGTFQYGMRSFYCGFVLVYLFIDYRTCG